MFEKFRKRPEPVYAQIDVKHDLTEDTQDFIERVFGPQLRLDLILKNQATIIDMLRPLGPVPADLLFAKEEGSTSHGLIFEINGKVDTMSSNIERIEKEAADMAENVGMVRTAVENLKAAQEDLKTLVADLQAQVAQGQLDQARLDAAAASLEKSDDDLDAIVLPPAPPVEPPTEG